MTKGLMAGRDLDALIAVEVMGWTIRAVQGVQLFQDAYHNPRFFAPDYSTTYEGAGLVIERMRELGWEGYDVDATDGVPLVRFWKDGVSPGADAPTLPHAVCLAALAAVRSTK